MSRQAANGRAPSPSADQHQPGPRPAAAQMRRHAHRVVFLHEPRPREPAEPQPTEG